MSRSRYLIVGGLFLSTALFLLAHGETVFADLWDSYGDSSGSSEYSGSFYFPSQESQTDTVWGNETYAEEPIQYLQPLQPLDYSNLWANNTAYTPTPNAESGSTDFTQAFSAQSEPVTQTAVHPENPLFSIFGWNLAEQPTVLPEALPLGWGFLGPQTTPPAEAPINVAAGVPETRTDVDAGLLQNDSSQAPRITSGIQFWGGAETDVTRPGSVSSVDAMVRENLSTQGSPNNSGFQRVNEYQPGVQSLTTRALQVVRDFMPGVSDFFDTVTGRSRDNAGSPSVLQLNSVSKSGISAQSGGVDYSASWRPGNVYFQAGWNVDSNFRLVK